MIDIAPFLFWKILSLAAILVVWLWLPFVIVVVYKSVDDLSTLWKVIMRVVICSVGALALATYWSHIWPEPVTRSVHAQPLDSIHEYAMIGYGEYKKGVEAKAPIVRTERGTEIRRYRLDDWNPPKHFYVTITDVKSGEHFESLYVSKHCNSAGQLKRGEEYNVVLRKYSLSNEPDVIRYEFPDLSPVFCP